MQSYGCPILEDTVLRDLPWLHGSAQRVAGPSDSIQCRQLPDNADGWVFIHLLSGNPLGVLKGTCSSSWAIPLLGLWLETGLLGFWVIVNGKLLVFLMMPIM